MNLQDIERAKAMLCEATAILANVALEVTTIVVASEKKAHDLRRKLDGLPFRVVSATSPTQLSGFACRLVLVESDVDLNRLVEGTPLGGVLVNRTRTFPDGRVVVF